MKIIDTRDLTVMEGDLVATLPANTLVSEEEMQRFYKMAPGSRNYTTLAKPCTYERVVLRRGDPAEDHFYIIPLYPFYRVEQAA